MKYEDAIKLFNNSAREMGETLGVSQPAVQYWKKTGKIPKVRQQQIELLRQNSGNKEYWSDGKKVSKSVFDKLMNW